MENGRSLIAVFAVLGLILAGAVAYLVGHKTEHFVEPLPRTGALSRKIEIDFYVDGSGSMKNLLAGGGENYLHQFLARSESTLRNPPIRNGWDEPVIHFWKFGSKMTPLDGVGALTRLANSPRDFNEPRTPIEAPANDDPQASVKPAERRPEVKIIVTDLYQSDQANEKPAIALTSRYLSNSLGAVAVLAVRNPYVGPVEDLPGMSGRSLPNAADSMPFYVIIAGDRAADVRQAQKLLIAETGLQGALDQQLGFAVYFSKDPGDFREGPPAFDWHGAGNSGEKAVGVAEPNHKDGVAMLSLRKGMVRVNWPGTVLNNAVYEAQTGQDLELHPHALTTSRSGGDQDNLPALKAEAKCNWPQSMCAVFDREKLKTGVEYLFRFDVIATSPSDVFRPRSGLMQQWNIEPGDVDAIARSGDKKFPPQSGLPGRHPGMTPNLWQFLTALQGQMFHVKDADTDPVRAATYYLYVKGR